MKWLWLIMFLLALGVVDAKAGLDPSEYDVIQDKQNYDRLDNYRTADFELAKEQTKQITKIDARLEYTIGILAAIGILVGGILVSMIKKKLHLILIISLLLAMFAITASAPKAYCYSCIDLRCQVNIQCWNHDCGGCDGYLFRCF